MLTESVTVLDTSVGSDALEDTASAHHVPVVARSDPLAPAQLVYSHRSERSTMPAPRSSVALTASDLATPLPPPSPPLALDRPRYRAVDRPTSLLSTAHLGWSATTSPGSGSYSASPPRRPAPPSIGSYRYEEVCVCVCGRGGEVDFPVLVPGLPP